MHPADHAYAEHLKRKSVTWHARFTEAQVCAPDFMERYVEACRVAKPFTGFLAKALGVGW